MAVAVNCWVAVKDRYMTGLAGVKEIEGWPLEVTARVVLAETVPKVVVMVAVPSVRAVAKPLLPIVATNGLDDPQVTCEVRSWVVSSEKVPVAVNC